MRGKKNVAECKEIFIKQERTIYFRINKKTRDIFTENTYLFWVKETETGCTISSIFVDKIIDSIPEGESVLETKKGNRFEKVDDIYFCQLEEERIRDYEYADLAQFKRLLKRTILDFKLHILECRYDWDDERKKYLIDTYFGKPEEFESNSKTQKQKWLKETNDNELDLYYEISLYELHRKMKLLIKRNAVIINADKLALESYCTDELDYELCSIGAKSSARFQMDDYMGVRVDNRKKELIWGHRTAYPIRVGFSFFWGFLKNILSLTYVPAVLLLLNNEYKIPIYMMLSMVYLIALILSDEKQLDRLLDGTDTFPEGISYTTLYYYGLMISISFVLFSIEMVIAPSNDVRTIVQYLLANLVGAYFIIIVCNMVISVLCFAITLWSATRFYHRVWKKGKEIFANVLVTVLYVLGSGSIIELLEIPKYLDNNTTVESWKVIVLALALAAVLYRIVAIWSAMFMKRTK